MEGSVLGVVVVITGEKPQQFENWEQAINFAQQHAQNTDPVQVSMFTLYWDTLSNI